MNVYDMAKKAKVSIATISRAVNPRTRHKVAAAHWPRLISWFVTIIMCRIWPRGV